MREIKKNIYWVGKVDWEIREFHGSEYSTHRGTTYNSYLVEDEKTALIDTVWSPFGTEFVESLDKHVSLKDIDFVVAQHAEIDHSGGLAELMERIPDTPVYCSKNGVKSLKGHFHKDWNFVPVKTGDKLSLGKKELVFIEAPLLHWPDSMFSYLTEDNILFSNDAFGQHLATELLYNDLVDQDELFQECIKYYANILTPFSGLVEKKIEEFKSLNVPIDMICPSHGVIWRKNLGTIISAYKDWVVCKPKAKVLVVYDTMWKSTEKMARAILEGAIEGDVEARLINIRTDGITVLASETLDAAAIAFGSPTLNMILMPQMAAGLTYLKGLKPVGKAGFAFGSYGWAKGGAKEIEAYLKDMKFEILREPLQAQFVPSEETLEECRAAGRLLADKAQLLAGAQKGM